MKNLTTKKQFEIFKAETLKWLEFFGLKGWQVHFIHKKTDARAKVIFNCVGRIATFILSAEWAEFDGIQFTDHGIKKCAFHEVCELFLGRLNNMTTQRFNLDELDVEEEIHQIIRTLEHVIFEYHLNQKHGA